jgi:hypothetical protein
MQAIRRKIWRDEGWTFIEATLSIVIMTIMVLGLTILMLAFKEHLDRSWAVRTMDQYGNDMLEVIAHDLRNANDATVSKDTDFFDKLNIHTVDKYNPNVVHSTVYSVNRLLGVIVRNNRIIDATYPPRRLRRNEAFQIVSFKVRNFGDFDGVEAGSVVFDPRERVEATNGIHNEKFLKGMYTFSLVLRYYRGPVQIGDHEWFLQRSYDSRAYIRNKNLTYKQGITG